MQDTRVFLGWDEPCLPMAAKWLRGRYGHEDGCDMSRALVVLPGGRAGRRLLELLVEPGGIFVPPRIVTIGALPEFLYEAPGEIAAPLQSQLAWTYALRSADRAVLAAIVPQPPEDQDLLGWLSLAGDLEKLREDLAGEAVAIESVIERCREQPDFNDEARWLALGELHLAAKKLLAERGLIDLHEARLEALRTGRCRAERDVVLIATTDLNQIARQMLEQAASAATTASSPQGSGDGATLISLVHAPQSERESFDALGCLKLAAWCEREIEVADERIHIVDRPRDQGMQVLRIIGDGKGTSQDTEAGATLAGRYRADEITIGIGDETMTSALHRTLELAGLPAHSIVGRPLTQSRPAMLLKGLADFVRHQRLSDFASLLRHPDLEPFLHDKLAEAGDALCAAAPDAGARHASAREAMRATIDHWLTLLDDYISEHLLAQTIGQWLGGADRAGRLKAVFDAMMSLLPEHPQMRRPLPAWREAVAAVLSRAYETQALDPHEPRDADLIRAFEAIGSALRDQAALDGADALTPRLAFADAVDFLLAQLAQVSAPVAGEPAGGAIELLGWLELQLDDAPALIITGFNEHQIPQSATADAFLPDHLRRTLGLMDNRRRYGRDAAALCAILHSKQFLAIIAGRRGGDDEPLKPSRLLLTGDGAALAHRILRFYPKDPAASAPASSGVLLPYGDRNRFLIPAPKPPEKPIDRMSVTWFKTYLDCPYRFYLRHIRKLETRDDSAIELDGMLFGNLAHTALSAFGKSPAKHSDDERVIAGFLAGHLDGFVSKQFGEQPPVAMVLQIHQLHDRLASFARWQAESVREGWRIMDEHIECSATTTFDIDGADVTVHGRIDRIDRHADGRHRIIDYKTGDRGDGPEKTHRAGSKNEKTWIDLQLPLYHRLAGSLNITGEIELGYMLLAKKREEITFAAAPWDAAVIADGIAKAEEVIRSIRDGIFWPPREPGGYEDEFDPICLDHYTSRKQAVLESAARMAGGKERAR